MISLLWEPCHLCSGSALCSGFSGFTEIAVFIDPATQVGGALVSGGPTGGPHVL